MYLVSVIIPNFNAERWIRQTLESVFTQNIDNMEIILIDDGSTDRSASIIQNEFPNVRLIETKNQGPSRARNLGTKSSGGEFIQYLDADDLLAPGKLKIQLGALKSSGSDIAYGDWQKLVKREEDNFEKGEKVKRSMQNPEIDLFTDFWCPPAAYLFRRSIVEKVGGWNERLPVIQDARFALDCALRGGSFVYCPGIMAYYRVHSRGSVSTGDSIAFRRDILNNAVEIENWWKEHGGVNDERKKALLTVNSYLARTSFENDKDTFEAAYRALEKIKPGYVPDRPWRLKLASQLFGYRKAEVIASQWRHLLKFFKNS